MTLEELRAVTADLIVKTEAVSVAQENLRVFLEQIATALEPGPISSVLDQADVDEIVAAQAPIYIGHLTAIETATDALGTDPFH